MRGKTQHSCNNTLDAGRVLLQCIVDPQLGWRHFLEVQLAGLEGGNEVVDVVAAELVVGACCGPMS